MSSQEKADSDCKINVLKTESPWYKGDFVYFMGVTI